MSPAGVKLTFVALPETYAAIQPDPVYSFITPSTELKYKAPATRALPSLSNAGSLVLSPR